MISYYQFPINLLQMCIIKQQQQMENKGKDIPANKPQKDTFQTIWKTINIILFAIQLYCIPGFLSFREITKEKEINFVRNQAWIWALASCIIYGIVKYSFFAITKSIAYAVVHPKYYDDQKQRNYRAQSILKLSFDLIYYSISSFAAFFLFRDKYWFPTQLGGSGDASLIYKQYPSWPSDTDPFIIETYYMIQLGVYAFKIIQSFAIRRKTYRKVYEFLLHHFIAETLIVFSLLSNQLTIGVVILFLHDFCDITTDLVRIYVQLKYRKTFISVFLFISSAITWLYMRLIIYPVYVIRAVYNSIPDAEGELKGIWFQHIFLLILCSMLVVMHWYWWLHLMRSGVLMLKGKGVVNPHDKGTKVKQY